MNSIETLTTFLGWCSVLNLGLLISGGTIISMAHDAFGEIAGKMMGVTSGQAKIIIFTVLRQYRFFIIFFNIVPYIALKIMA